MAFSSRRFPMKHQGHTTSEKTSIASGVVVMVGGSCIVANLCTTRNSRNRSRLRNARAEGLDTVARLEHGERHHGDEARRLARDTGKGPAVRDPNAANEGMVIAQSGIW